MSRYTTEVRYICESLAGMTHAGTVDDMETVILRAYPQIFSDRIIVEPAEHREELLCKILEHYYTREIGLETFGLWKQKLNTKMKEIMPYYNEMYKTVGLNFSPIHDVDYERTIDNEHEDELKRNDKGESNTTVNNSSNSEYNDTSWNKTSLTPQGGVNGLDEDRYLTSAVKNTDASDSTNTASGTTENKSESEANENTDGTYHTVEKVKGKMGTRTYASMLREYRQNIINVDMMIIEELADLFINLW